MFCSKCGADVVDGVTFCPACGQPMGGVGTVAYGAPGAAARHVTYAGFWLRFVAFIIDAIIIAVATLPFRLVLGAMFGIRMGLMGPQRISSPDMIVGSLLPMMMLSLVVNMVVNWLYFAFCESSSWQATLGKKALGLEVTDLDGNRISFARASGRFFGKIISGATLLIGYIIAGFTEKKQALHDLMAGTLVIRKV
jgi:uncharacterized RDD family membrane protein YckC